MDQETRKRKNSDKTDGCVVYKKLNLNNDKMLPKNAWDDNDQGDESQNSMSPPPPYAIVMLKESIERRLKLEKKLNQQPNQYVISTQPKRSSVLLRPNQLDLSVPNSRENSRVDSTESSDKIVLLSQAKPIYYSIYKKDRGTLLCFVISALTSIISTGYCCVNFYGC